MVDDQLNNNRRGALIPNAAGFVATDAMSHGCKTAIRSHRLSYASRSAMLQISGSVRG
jgi:hypothetical protein